MCHCGSTDFARGMCRRHYDQARFSGGMDVQGWSKSEPLDSRLSRRVDDSAGPDACWPWTGATDGQGYGHFRFQGRFLKAHRVSYSLAVGEIEDGYEIDHQCRNKRCCNPSHLRLATHKQNLENLSGALSNNRTGVRGVSFQRGKYVARVRHNGVSHYVGTFSTLEMASDAVVSKRNELFTHNDSDRILPS